jgi:hypothetical protein
MTTPDSIISPELSYGLGFITDDRQMAQLPTAGSSWPPSQFSPVQHTQAIWNAWWNGDPHMLSWVYFNLGENSPVGRSFFATTGEKNATTPRAGQYTGGLIGGVDYTFWGNPVPPGEKRNKTHVPLAKTIARTSANLLFRKPPAFKSQIDNAANEEYFKQLVDTSLHMTLLSAAETGSALGGVFLRIQWNTAIADRPWIEVIAGDMGFPEFTSGKLTAVTFMNEVFRDDDKVIRHVEKHVPAQNAILHGLYEGNETSLGERIPLTDFPETEPFASACAMTPGPDDRIVFPDLPLEATTVVYVPNMLPNQLWRDLGPNQRSLGVSDFSGAEILMDQMDEAYSELRTELQLTRTRLMVPEEFLDNLGKGKGAVFEPARQVYVPMNGLHGDDGGSPMQPFQPTIRVQQYLDTIQDLYNQAVRAAGYSTQTFGDYQGNAPTATEIMAREKTSMMTRDTKIGLWSAPLSNIIYGLMEVEVNYFGNTAITPERPEVEFGAVAESDEFQLAATAVALASSGGASMETIISTIHPDWTQDQIDAERQKILDDRTSGIVAPAAPPAPAKPLALKAAVSEAQTIGGTDVS